MSTLPTSIPTTPPAPVSFWEAFRYWLKLGFISFGGPAGQISMMHQELVEKRRWISEHRFLHALNYCMVLPGPEAIQLAIYIGWLMHGVLGGIVAGVLFFLPALVLLISLSWIYIAFGDLPVVAGVLYGIKPAVTAIVVFAAYRIGSKALKNAACCGRSPPPPLLPFLPSMCRSLRSCWPRRFSGRSADVSHRTSSRPAAGTVHQTRPTVRH